MTDASRRATDPRCPLCGSTEVLPFINLAQQTTAFICHACELLAARRHFFPGDRSRKNEVPLGTLRKVWTELSRLRHPTTGEADASVGTLARAVGEPEDAVRGAIDTLVGAGHIHVTAHAIAVTTTIDEAT